MATLLVIGFALHNATEGFGIVAPLAAETDADPASRPSWGLLLLLAAIGGGPTFVGTIVGHAFTSEPVSVVFLTLAAGSIIYVIVQLLAIAGRSSRKDLIYLGVLLGLLAGFAHRRDRHRRRRLSLSGPLVEEVARRPPRNHGLVTRPRHGHASARVTVSDATKVVAVGFGPATSSGLRSTCGGFEVLAGVLPTTSGKNLCFSLWTRAFDALECRWRRLPYWYESRDDATRWAGRRAGRGGGPGGRARPLLWSARTDDELVGVVEQVQQAKAVLAAVEAAAVAEADARDLAKKKLHYASTGDWLTHAGGLRRGDGRRLVRRAVALTGPLARTRAGMVEGTVSPEQADVIVHAVADLPGAMHLRRRAEKQLVRYAGRFDATDLARTGRHLIEVVDPDGSTAGSKPSSTAKPAPRTPTGTSPSPPTAPAASG